MGSTAQRVVAVTGWVGTVASLGWAFYSDKQSEQRHAIEKAQIAQHAASLNQQLQTVQENQLSLRDGFEKRLKTSKIELDYCQQIVTSQSSTIQTLQQENETLLKKSLVVPEQFKPLEAKGLPSKEHVQFLEGYALSFDYRTRNPCWSCEHLSRTKSIQSGAARNESEFREDPNVPEIFRSKLADYRGSGYDRGHLTPAADITFSQKAMNETFILSNISPQVGNGFNRHYWARLEKFTRSLLERFEDVYICSGPLYLPETKEDGKHYVTYEVIGNPPNVAVPTHFYKTVLVENPVNSDSQYSAVASFVLPNQKIHPNTPVEEFLVPLESLNRMSGLQFWNGVSPSQSSDLCASGQCALPSPDWWKANDKAFGDLKESVDKFVASPDEEFHYPETLSGKQRADLHKLAEDNNLLHFSVGEGTQRHIVIKKK